MWADMNQWCKDFGLVGSDRDDFFAALYSMENAYLEWVRKKQKGLKGRGTNSRQTIAKNTRAKN